MHCSKDELALLGKIVSIPNRFEGAADDGKRHAMYYGWSDCALAEAMSLAEMTMYGLKGLAAYAHHAGQLGARSENTYAFVHKARLPSLSVSAYLSCLHTTTVVPLDFSSRCASICLTCVCVQALSQLANPRPAAGDMLALALETGKANVEVMAMLDRAHTEYAPRPRLYLPKELLSFGCSFPGRCGVFLGVFRLTVACAAGLGTRRRRLCAHSPRRASASWSADTTCTTSTTSSVRPSSTLLPTSWLLHILFNDFAPEMLMDLCRANGGQRH